jgi:hypothetical protein
LKLSRESCHLAHPTPTNELYLRKTSFEGAKDGENVMIGENVIKVEV